MNNDLISREALKNVILNDRKLDGANANWEVNRILVHIDNAPTVEGPKYILKTKNLTAENKKRFQEEWNKSAGGLLAIPDNYEIIPIERPRGEWIFEKANEEHTDGYICSNCKRSFHTKVPYFSEFNFCPNCGANMRGGAE